MNMDFFFFWPALARFLFFLASSEKNHIGVGEGLYVQGIEMVRRHKPRVGYENIKQEIQASDLRSAYSVQGNHLAKLSVVKPLIFYRK